MHQPQHPAHLQFVHRHTHQIPGLQLTGYRHLGNQRHAVAHGHKSLDGLDGRQLDAHVQRGPVALESLDHLAPQGRGHVVGDKGLLSQIADRDPPGAGQRVAGAHHEGQAVGIDGNGAELHRVGPIGDNPQLEGAQVQFLGNAAGQHPVHGDADVGKLPPVRVDRPQQIHAGILVGRQLQSPPLQALQLAHGAGGLAPQGQQAQGIVAQQHPGRRQRPIARRTVEERLAHRRLQLADHLTHRRLGAVQPHRRPREAPLLGHRQKCFELIEFHSRDQFSAISCQQVCGARPITDG